MSKSNRGFASMSPEMQRKISSMGGKAAHAQGKAHEFTKEEAKAAGKLGGARMTSEQASIIGKLGGIARGKNKKKEAEEKKKEKEEKKNVEGADGR